MTHLLVTAATEKELATWGESPLTEKQITGVGVPETFIKLGRLLQKGEYNLIVNVGIAGAYEGLGINIGDMVVGEREVYGDIGMETPETEPPFTPLAQSEWGGHYQKELSLHYSPEFKFEGFGFEIFSGTGVTVNQCSGTENTGALRRDLFKGTFETMEGAAVAELGREFQIPVLEVRAISNIAAQRDMQAKNIKKALSHLGLYLTYFKKKYEQALFHSHFTLPQ